MYPPYFVQLTPAKAMNTGPAIYINLHNVCEMRPQEGGGTVLLFAAATPNGARIGTQVEESVEAIMRAYVDTTFSS